MGRSCRWRLSFVFLQQEHDTFKEFSFLKPFPTHGAFLSKDNCPSAELKHGFSKFALPFSRNFETFTTKLETPSCNFRFTKLFQSANKLHEDLAQAQHSQPKRSFALGLLFHSVLSQSTVADFTPDKAAGFPTAVRQAGSFLYGLTTHKRAALADSRFKH